MEGGDSCGEHLFSLELLVESARVEPRLLPTPLPVSGPFRPAVALRLLDFPTLLVRAPEAAPGPVVPFGRGKSCLFRLRPDALKGLLRRSPLHALLLALPPDSGPARLLGSSSVCLAAAAEELLLGSGPVGGRGHFPLRDLMGEPVGELKLSYRLNSLGSSGLEHFEREAATDEAQAGDQQPQQLPCPPGKAAERRVSLELISEGEEDQDPAPGGGSQGSLSSPSTDPEPFTSSSSGEEIAGELEIDTNAFCPPPMYYSHQTEKCCPSPKPNARVIIMAAQDSPPKEGTSLPFVKEEPAISTEEAFLPSPYRVGSSEQLRQTLSQLPLLNALLVELSLLNSQPLPPGPSAVHPQLAWLYQNTEEGTKTPPSNGKNLCACWDDKKHSPHRRERGRSPSPKLKRNHPDRLKGICPICPGKAFTKQIYLERPLSPEKINTKENSPPRRKLTYGLTNTLRLRLQRSNPGMLKVHEKREHRRKKLGEISFEKKGKRSLAKEKIFQGSFDCHPKSSGQCDEKSIPDQNAQINENVETLIQSSADRNSPMTTKKISSRIPKKVGASGVKSRDNAKGKHLPEIVDSSYKEKSLEVHLPRVFLQDTEALENPINAKIEKCVHHDGCNISYIYKDRQINNFEKSHARKNSDSVVNSENAAYSEDFTSIDSCGISFEAPESSPEPLPINSDHSQSGIDSDSKNSKSLPAKCISPLLPIPSAISPVQTLKKTYDLKSIKKKTDIGLNKYDDSLARTLRDQLTVHEKETKVTQTSEDNQEYSDTNCNIAKSQSSVEKSHSVRTSQVSSYLPSSVSDLELSGLEESKAPDKEKEDGFGMMDITNRCKHISELVINKLPGYTM
ncbi:microtubule-associated protein 10 [Candoia aspera]|uniref:microtubule-associated protein 10 n=1 Tax=Candoia aspera TaxID=51853 RepID=UPI002FD86EA9